MSNNKSDFLVIGAGIAGASAAARLSQHGSVIVLERESQPGYHTTGRSAATFEPSYGSHDVRKLILASEEFLRSPTVGYGDGSSFLSPRGIMAIFRADQKEAMEREFEDVQSTSPDFRILSQQETLERVPILDPDYMAASIYSDLAQDIDVHALHQAYLGVIKSNDSQLIVNADVTAISHHASGGDWHVDTAKAGSFSAPIVINAAGAWCDVMAELAGVPAIGLEPRRRNAVLIPGPEGYDVSSWPMLGGSDPAFYFKPDAGRLMVSPEDAIPSPPCDARPDEMDIAIAIDRFENATTVSVKRPEHTWAGLRSFVADEMLVAGFDPDPAHSGFFWLTGQGGYGIETSPAMSLIASSLVRGTAFPDHMAAFDLSAADVAPGRLK
ncbi:MAG: FAD-binding oxidoreductase [Rhodospirillales bacterium]|nr:FAD-binding oxidoreductase [Rhodospirillales bacterium]MBT4041828.1 FAD-binding oxidoreductase [Rhodospirillales bacterium]MBT5351635.1 FAD-binding oxidoreductase [Rhodospirillales bacterium]MBT5520961.1 FAD-binding oxidoreductase [Rhodospirillales bacterium]MBT6110283.1 FAD-binding oxidoreductase [Rhodospirillales bacterium]